MEHPMHGRACKQRETDKRREKGNETENSMLLSYESGKWDPLAIVLLPAGFRTGEYRKKAGEKQEKRGKSGKKREKERASRCLSVWTYANYFFSSVCMKWTLFYCLAKMLIYRKQYSSLRPVFPWIARKLIWEDYALIRAPVEKVLQNGICASSIYISLVDIVIRFARFISCLFLHSILAPVFFKTLAIS